MADVTGTIGNEYVELNNAATEATLKLLLQATLAASKGSTEEVKKIAALAGRAGLDSASIERANNATRNTTPQISKLGQAATAAGTALGSIKGEIDQIGQLMKKIAAGNAEASDLFSAMGMLPGPLGVAAKGFQKLAEYQEGLLKTYQDLTTSGINFGGSLTDMRMAASNAYLTLDEFASIMKTNSSLLAKLGGSASDGAVMFNKAAATLVKGDLGDDLRALGYTSKDLNQGLADYLTLTGGRTREEMRNTQQLAQGAAQYLEQLDGLSRLTGESREQLAEKLKQDKANAAWEAYLLTLTPKEKEKALAGLAESLAKGGQGAADLLKAELMGLPVQTKAGQEFSTMAQNGAAAVRDMAANVKDQTKTTSDIQTASAQLTNALAEDGRRLKGVGSAILMSGVASETLSKTMGAANDQVRNNIKSEKDQVAFEEKVRKEQKAKADSEAAQAATTQAAMKELSKSVNEITTYFASKLLPIVNEFVKVLAENKEVVVGIIGALLVAKAGLAARKVLGGGGGIAESIAGGGGGAGAGGGGGAGKALGGVADGIGKLGPAMKSLGTGAGGMISGLLKGIAGGLRAFANPAVALGAAGFGAAIAAIGAGIAAASWLTGKALPTLSEGMASLQGLDGDKLGNNAKGMALIGGSLLTFVPFGVTGLPAAYATGMLADNLTKLAAVDPVRLEKTAAAMQKVKDATPSLGQSISQGVSGLFGKIFGEDEKTSSEPSPLPVASSENENLLSEVQRLNSVSREILTYIKQNADYAKQNVDATKALNDNLF